MDPTARITSESSRECRSCQRTANVWRVVPGEEPQVHCTGFSFILDLDFDRRGTLYDARAHERAVPNGRGCTLLHAIARDCSRTAVVTGLTNPTSVAIGPDGDAYISNFGTSPATGEVIRVDLRRRGGR